MGQLRKKIGLKFSSIIGSWLLIVLFAFFALVVQYLIFFKKLTSDVINYAQYTVYLFILVDIALLVAFYVKFSINIPISLYEKGIFMKRKKVSIMYNEIETYYFTPASDNRMKSLIVEKMNKDKFIFDISYVGEDFVDIFQKDYIATFTNDIVEKVKHGYEVGFGIMSGRQKTVFKVFNTKGMAKNLTFADEFYICRDGLKYDDEFYKWSNIRAGYDIQTGNIEIVDITDNQMILNTYFTYVEKGEFPFNIIDILVDEVKNNGGVLEESLFEEDDDKTEELKNDDISDVSLDDKEAQVHDYSQVDVEEENRDKDDTQNKE